MNQNGLNSRIHADSPACPSSHKALVDIDYGRSIRAPGQPAAKATGRFSEPVSDLVKRYTASVFFDNRMAARTSAARWPTPNAGPPGHHRRQDLADIERGMAQIAGEIEPASSTGTSTTRTSTQHRETPHRPGRRRRQAPAHRPQRNDQVATDIRLWLRDAIDTILGLIREFQLAVLDLAEHHADTPMPGFTHLQVAQPVTFGHHLLAYFEMTGRDAERFADCRKRVNRLPLGAAALAGTTFPDRPRIRRRRAGLRRRLLQLARRRLRPRLRHRILRRLSLLMTHLSRLSEELILWMSPRVGFIDLPTASAPARRSCRKEEPRRARTGRGQDRPRERHLIALLTLMKGQPLAYNKDNQEDKEPCSTPPTPSSTPAHLRRHDGRHRGAGPSSTCRVKRVRPCGRLPQGYATATDLADYLVKKGCPSATPTGRRRWPYAADAKGCDLPQIALAELRPRCHGPRPGRRRTTDVFQVLTVEGSLAATSAGTAPQAGPRGHRPGPTAASPEANRP